MRVPREGLPYLVGIVTGVFGFLLVTPLISVPPSFTVFAFRSMLLLFVAATAGYLVTDRYLGSTN